MDVDDLRSQRKFIDRSEKKQMSERERLRRDKERKIRVTEDVTENKLDKRTEDLIKILDLKEANNRSDFTIKEKVLRDNFSGTIEKLIGKIRLQRDMIL